ncbi:aminotransferase class III-fold pyridoxal phosphate-dependent enzyme [Rhodovarius crocodyli]|uniref:Aminotransferase class III-fold pyridoxal phosphate-dependent enzyme n=1 Tax=Rhodovarius crocodyli TaxID=1979269 RepID=A0A437M253_9PROT|nr:aminotransferase [Rhodovarius crocodyli]RVT91635.1 aminotransferase class III-fold pyridoxal phosphate-dependent enzyme [Rhodovarius crocodyli]
MNHPLNSWAARDQASVLHPYTNLAQHAETGPLVIRRGKGVRVQDEEGRWYLEGMAGLWSASLGFDEPRLVEAATKQLQALPFYHIFNGRSHEPAIELAEKLLSLAPAGLSRVLFSNSGSEANDAAIKLAWHYHHLIGKPQKRKIIGRERAYHGVTIAAASATGQVANHNGFGLPLPGFLRTGSASHWHDALPGENEADFVARRARELEELIAAEGADTIAAFIAEPVTGGGGVFVPPDGYFAAIQEVLRRHEILFIVDEVITGFGRTGTLFASERFGLRPDLLSTAKALSASFLPISALLVSEKINQALLAGSATHGPFAHGVTYAAHPVCAAVALETLRLYEERDIIGHIAQVSPLLQDGLRALLDHPLVGNARGVGLIGAVEIVADKAAKRHFDPALGVGARVQAAALKRGVILRGLKGDAIAACPPLIIRPAEIEELLGALRGALDDVQAWLEEQGHHPARTQP